MPDGNLIFDVGGIAVRIRASICGKAFASSLWRQTPAYAVNCAICSFAR